MKFLSYIVGFWAAAICASASSIRLEDISPHVSTNARVVWSAKAQPLPTSLWIYEKRQHVFSAGVISNALALGRFNATRHQRFDGKAFTIWDRVIEGDPRPDYFTVEPESGMIMCRREHHPVVSPKPNMSPVQKARYFASQLGVDLRLLAEPVMTTNSSNEFSVSLARKIDEVSYLDAGEGFSVTFDTHGSIRFFSLMWPNLERYKSDRVVGPETIISCIFAFKTPVLPDNDEPDYLARVRSYSKLTSLNITKITPVYGEGRYGEQSTGEALKYLHPIAILEAQAGFDHTNVTIHLFSPLLTGDVDRLLKRK